jgi:hypothetical protein
LTFSQSNNETNSTAAIVDARIQPNQFQMELEFPIEDQSGYYDPDSIFATTMKKNTMTSSQIPLKTNYAIGVVKGGIIATRYSSECVFFFCAEFFFVFDFDEKTKKINSTLHHSVEFFTFDQVSSILTKWSPKRKRKARKTNMKRKTSWSLMKMDRLRP